MNARNLLLAVALAFGIIETADIPHTGVPAAVFAVLFFACAAWLWRRGNIVAIAILVLQFLVEVTQAHTWNVPLPLEIVAMTLGTIGLAAAVATLLAHHRLRRRRRHPWPRSTAGVCERLSDLRGGERAARSRQACLDDAENGR